VTFVAAGAGILFSPAKTTWSGSIYNASVRGDWADIPNQLKMGFLGLEPNNTFGGDALLNGMCYTKLLLLAAVVHWVAGKTGINRMLGRAKVPFVRI